MLRADLRMALRHMARFRGTAALHVGGLAVGMTTFLLLMLWVQDELSFDRHHRHADRIARIVVDVTMGGSLRKGVGSAAPMGPALADATPDVQGVVRFTTPQRTVVERGDDLFVEESVFYADASVFEVFSFRLLRGDPDSALVAPYTVVLTESTARKYFGDDDPVGRILRFDGTEDFSVTGVMEDVPRNSHFTFDMLCSFETHVARGTDPFRRWGSLGVYTYVLLGEGTQPADIEGTLAGLVEENLGETLRNAGASFVPRLQPLTRIHLFSDRDSEIQTNGSIRQVVLFALVGFFVLAMACFNFVNLSVGRSAVRAREVGIRKALGAARRDLVRQFLVESTTYGLLAMLVSVLLVPLALPLFNDVAGRELSADWSSSPWLVPLLVALALGVGLAAGVYPALVLSSFAPVRALQGGPLTGRGRPLLRGVLVVTQFAIAIALIIGTLTIRIQLDSFRKRDPGFDPDGIVVLPNPAAEGGTTLERVKERLSRVPGVVAVAATSAAPGQPIPLQNCTVEGLSDDAGQFMTILEFDADYAGAMGLEIVRGRGFSEDLSTDETESVLVNETAVRRFGWEEPLGKAIRRKVPGPEGPVWETKRVVGVVRDFHVSSFHVAVEPSRIGSDPSQMGSLVVRIAPGSTPPTLGMLREAWNDVAPDRPFDMFLVKDRLARAYEDEERLGRLALLFSLLAISLGALGLFGMAAHVAERRRREVAVRRVLGASVPALVRLLSAEFLLLVAIANVFAWPVAHQVMARWLGRFAYRVDPGWSLYVAAGLAALLLAQIVVGFRTMAVARADPVRSLRTE